MNLAEACEREEVGLLAYSPLAQGYLTGKYDHGARPAGARSTLFNRGQRYETPGAAEALLAYNELARSFGMEPALFANAYVVSRRFVTSSIIGATSIPQLEMALSAADVDVDGGDAESGRRAAPEARQSLPVRMPTRPAVAAAFRPAELGLCRDKALLIELRSGGSIVRAKSRERNMAIEVAEGERVTITFDGHRCIHARRCVTGEPHVFRANVEGPWIDADAADPEALLHVAQNCPSGAIHVMRKDGGPNEHPPVANIVIVRENGPLAFHADLSIDGHEVGVSRHALPLRAVAQQAVLRQLPHQWRLRRERRAAVQGKHARDHRPHRPGRGEAGRRTGR